MHKVIVLLFSIILTSATYASTSVEVRAVWLTTNGGLDWPGKIKSVEEQKKSMTDMLDKLKDANFNLVIFQVQANGDVLWKSSIQPPMDAVTGDGSKPLSFDVCRFVIDECHKRDMECHAWIVPFRVGTKKQALKYAYNKVKQPVKSQSQLCINYKGTLYLDPGNPKTRGYLIKLYSELVEKYDFDGINLDYTRYPGNDFPDNHSYSKRKDKKQSKNDWRRNNINAFVKDLYKMVKSKKPHILLGSAPIGTYKNVGGYKNATAYDSFQQDPGQWISSGCHDLVIPQMYWDEKSGFSTHMSTWENTAKSSCHLVVGLAPYKIIDSGWTSDLVVSQILKTRNSIGVEGVCFFRAEHVIGSNPKIKSLYNRLKNDIFKNPADLPWRHSKAETIYTDDSSSEPYNPFLE